MFFTYRIEVGDVDADGVAVNANKLRLNGGSIRDNAADLTHDAVAADSRHKVSGHGGL